MTRPATHIWRLLKWGRSLARHGALRGIENDPNTPPQVKRLARVARFGAIGDEPAGGSPEEFAQTIAKDSAKWKDVVERAGVKLD